MASAAANAAKRIAVVTGANQGLGFHVVKQLAGGDHGPFHVLLGARSPDKGRDAIEKLGKPGNVELLEVDVSSDESVRAAADAVRERHGRVDLLINNAGWAAKGDAWGYDLAKKGIDVNYHGVRRMLDAFGPLLSAGQGRVTNVSSMAGHSALSKCSPELRERFMADDLTHEKLTELLNGFAESVRKETHKEDGWPDSMYGVSKIGCSMLTRIAARDGIDANAVCPGWCRTSMAGDKAPNSAEEGASRIVESAMLPGDEARGKFYSDRKETPWHK